MATADSTPDGLPAEQVPPELTRRLRQLLPSVADEVENEVRRQVPEYAEPDEALAERLRTGVVQALTLFIDHLTDPGGQEDSITCTYYELGWNTALAGRSLEAFQSAVRIGGLYAWQLMADAAEEVGLDPAVMSALGELAFHTLHELSEAAASGHTEAQLRHSEELERPRRQLLRLLLGEEPVAAKTLQELAHRARWTVPEQVTVVVLAAVPDGRDDEHAPTPVGTLADFDAHPPRLLLPDPGGSGGLEDKALVRALGGCPAAVGPTVPPTEAARSLQWAARALRLVERGVLPRQPLVRCTDHLPAMLLYSDEVLLAHLAADALAPLDVVPEAHRERLRETLLAWLLGGGNVPDMAERLKVHPQTVRYRLRQLEQLFGDKLHDSSSRLQLLLALQAVHTE
ncbi:helix-turn-helix domain-containing protein [Streptomyces sp. CA-249302]|uniref:helix-turn-helix domain-containing protein n=1 Tax=Streptomyces sp. CA-249302 TaxID=3240058 RepID=UPI003D8D5D29